MFHRVAATSAPSPAASEDLRTLTDLGLVDARDEGLVLTQAGIAVLNGS